MTKPEAQFVPLETVRRSRRSQPGWADSACLDDRGRIVANVASALAALRLAPKLHDVFSFDEMQRAILVVRPLPLWQGGAGNEWPSPRPLTDADVTQLQEWMQRAGLPKMGSATIHDAIELRSREPAFHPVRDYLESLRWDNRPRIGNWLTTYLGADDAQYAGKVGAMFLTAMVARIFQPGCKSDYMPVLEGPQGIMKSSACAILGGEWFSDNLPDITAGKDASQHLRGRWLIEVGEMSALGKAEAAHLKAFLTRTVERYRPAYGRQEVHEPRQCCFIGTTTDSIYLKDGTGGRRFWPIRVSKVDIDALRRDRDQLFAEAVARFRADSQWWPDADFERKHIAPQQASRLDIDAWVEPISSFLEERIRSTWHGGKTTVRVGQIASEALSIESRLLGTADQRRITNILAQLGWKRSETKIGGYYPWESPAKDRGPGDH
jgi:predicted P-loop ATPase